MAERPKHRVRPWPDRPRRARDPALAGLTAATAARCSPGYPVRRPSRQRMSMAPAIIATALDAGRRRDPDRCRRRAPGRRCAGRIRRRPDRRRRPARGAGPCRRPVVRRAARNHGRRHRHQRQDLGRHLHPPDLDAALGHAAINIGTTGVEGAWTAPSAHTTPDPITLHRMLAEAAAAGVTHAAMEASSPRPRPAPHGRRAPDGGGLHQPHPGPPGLSPHDSRPISPPRPALFDRVLLPETAWRWST